VDDRAEWDHNRWARIYEKFERAYLELPRRLFIEIAQLQASPPIRRILDIGCGDGKGLEYLRGRLAHAELVGIDPDRAMVKIARMRLRGRADVAVASVEDFPESLGRFDLILSYMNVHRWAEPVYGLKRVQAALTDDGMAYIVDVRRDISARLREEGLKWLPQENFRAVSAAQIDSGLTIEEMRGRMDEAGITAYRLLTGMPWGSGRGAGIAGGRAGRRYGPIGEITNQMAEMSLGRSAKSISSAQMHVFLYPQPKC
jgi:SAM-dependent methyltransferase